MRPQVVIGLNAVIMAVTAGAPRILTVKRAGHSLAPGRDKARIQGDGSEPVEALPFGPLDPVADRTLELGLRRWVREQTGLELGYVEQLYTFGNRNRDPQELEGGPRVISVAYLALVREDKPSGTGEALWRECYQFLPWEDWRSGPPEVIRRTISPALEQWIAMSPGSVRQEKRERCDINFGMRGAPWVPERVLDRYELLYEVCLAAEALRDGLRPCGLPDGEKMRLQPALGRPMALDHRRILASALGRLRGKLKYRPVVFELLPPNFTLLQLQRVVEALAGARLHKPNLRRLVERGGLVEGTGALESRTGGRPAELFRFRREVLRERPAPGVGLQSHRKGARP